MVAPVLSAGAADTLVWENSGSAAVRWSPAGSSASESGPLPVAPLVHLGTHPVHRDHTGLDSRFQPRGVAQAIPQSCQRSAPAIRLQLVVAPGQRQSFRSSGPAANSSHQCRPPAVRAYSEWRATLHDPDDCVITLRDAKAIQ